MIVEMKMSRARQRRAFWRTSAALLVLALTTLLAVMALTYWR